MLGYDSTNPGALRALALRALAPRPRPSGPWPPALGPRPSGPWRPGLAPRPRPSGPWPPALGPPGPWLPLALHFIHRGPLKGTA